MDVTTMSDADLQAMASGDMSKMSDEGLNSVAGTQPEQTGIQQAIGYAKKGMDMFNPIPSSMVNFGKGFLGMPNQPQDINGKVANYLGSNALPLATMTAAQGGILPLAAGATALGTMVGGPGGGYAAGLGTEAALTGAA